MKKSSTAAKGSHLTGIAPTTDNSRVAAHLTVGSQTISMCYQISRNAGRGITPPRQITINSTGC